MVGFNLTCENWVSVDGFIFKSRSLMLVDPLYGINKISYDTPLKHLLTGVQFKFA